VGLMQYRRQTRTGALATQPLMAVSRWRLPTYPREINGACKPDRLSPIATRPVPIDTPRSNRRQTTVSRGNLGKALIYLHERPGSVACPRFRGRERPVGALVIAAPLSEAAMATGSAAPQCGAASGQPAPLGFSARPRRTGVRRSRAGPVCCAFAVVGAAAGCGHPTLAAGSRQTQGRLEAGAPAARRHLCRPGSPAERRHPCRPGSPASSRASRRTTPGTTQKPGTDHTSERLAPTRSRRLARSRRG